MDVSVPVMVANQCSRSFGKRFVLLYESLQKFLVLGLAKPVLSMGLLNVWGDIPLVFEFLGLALLGFMYYYQVSVFMALVGYPNWPLSWIFSLHKASCRFFLMLRFARRPISKILTEP